MKRKHWTDDCFSKWQKVSQQTNEHKKKELINNNNYFNDNSLMILLQTPFYTRKRNKRNIIHRISNIELKQCEVGLFIENDIKINTVIIHMKRHQTVFIKQHERKVYMQIVKIMANWERVTHYLYMNSSDGETNI